MCEAKEQISQNILMITIACYIQSSTLLSGFVTDVTKNEAWISAIIGFIMSIPGIMVFISLAERFPGKSIIEINSIIFGKIMGKVISALYALFFFSLAFLDTSVMNHFIGAFMLPETPIAAIAILFIFVCAWAVRKGAETITRYSMLLFAFVITILLFNGTLMIKNMSYSNLFPIFDLPIKNYLQGAHIIAALPLWGTFTCFAFLPNVQKGANIRKAYWGGLTLGSAVLLFVVIRDTAVLGPMMSSFTQPTFQAVGIIDIGGILTRMEALYVIILLTSLFFQISVILYATVKSTAELFCLRSYKVLVPVISVLVVCFSLLAFNSFIELNYWGTNIAPIVFTLFEVVLPVMTLLVASLRGYRKIKE